MAKSVLITGASIAGNTAAWWLARSGCDVTVVEKAVGFRQGGQNVDIHGAAEDVIRKMELREEVAARGTGETGMAIVRDDGSVIAQFGVGQGFTAELEILRDDLAQVIYEPARKMAKYRFGDTIAAVNQDEQGASVTFASGRCERYDAVIVAEGVGSSTRELLFPGENRPRFMDMTIGYFTIPKGPADNQVACWYPAQGGISAMLRPDRQGNSRAFLMVQGKPDGKERRTVAEQQKFFRKRFDDAGWQTRRILDGMFQSNDFYYDVLRQVRLDRWSNGCVVLTGDAAWCPTVLSGMGSSLAIMGAYHLAAALAENGNLSHAFAKYERVVRPVVRKQKPVPKIIPRLMHPRTAAGLACQRGIFRIIADARVRRLARLVSDKDEPVSPAV